MIFTSNGYQHEIYREENLMSEKELLIRKWEQDDREIFHSQWRKDDGWIVKEIRTRTRYLLDYGEMTYKRRYYWRYNASTGKKEYAYLLGRHLQFRKLHKYHHSVGDYIKKLHGECLSNPEIQSQLRKKKINMSLPHISLLTQEPVHIPIPET